MKKIKIILFFLIFIVNIFAQETMIKKNQLRNTKIKAFNIAYLEIGGVAGHYSFNYERVFLQTKLVNIGAGIGFSPSVIESDMKFTPRIPIRLNFFKNISYQHNIEIGMIYNPYINSHDELYHSIFANIGYRYQTNHSGLFMKINFTPMIYNNAIKFIPWGGASIGYSF